MANQELTPLQLIMVGYEELKKEATKEEDAAATLAKEQEKVAEGVALKQSGKTFLKCSMRVIHSKAAGTLAC